jgi:pyruvate formate lyase activating enzyme
MHPKLLEKMMEISLISGGCVKFDLKAFDERLNLALCGINNKRTLENFALASSYLFHIHYWDLRQIFIC